MYREPTSHTMNASTGDLSGATGRYEKRLRELAGIYSDADAFQTAVAESGDRVVYSVDEVRPPAGHGDVIFGTTFMQPGRISDEFFMTRGHIHACANRPETYYGESGTGVMLMESPEGETRVLEISARVLVYVPQFWIHRSVNTGTNPLVMSFCYPSDSGQNYDVIGNSGGMAVRILADGPGWRTAPNPDYRPRSCAEIDAIHATKD